MKYSINGNLCQAFHSCKVKRKLVKCLTTTILFCYNLIMITSTNNAQNSEQKMRLSYAMKMAQGSRYEYQQTQSEATFKTAQFWTNEVSRIAKEKVS